MLAASCCPYVAVSQQSLSCINSVLVLMRARGTFTMDRSVCCASHAEASFTVGLLLVQHDGQPATSESKCHSMHKKGVPGLMAMHLLLQQSALTSAHEAS